MEPNTPTTAHLHGFVDGLLNRKSIDAMLPHMADDMVLHTPLAAEPARGKDAIRPIVVALTAVVDRFTLREILHGPDHVAVAFGVRVGDAELDGMDYIRLDADGRVKEMHVLWRPLPAIIAVLSRLNVAAGRPGVALTPVSPA